MIEKITQTFMQYMRGYLAGEECGNLIYEMFVNDRLFEDEEPGSKGLGAYYEFCVSGALPKNGKIPMPEYMKSAVKKNGGTTAGLGVDDMYEPYRLAHENAKRTRALIEEMGLEIVEAGQRYPKPGDDSKGPFEGTIDLRVRCVREVASMPWSVGEEFVIDLKYSGMIGEKSNFYNKFGWGNGLTWSNIQRRTHGTQAIQYHYVTDLEFYFLVRSSSNETDVEFFRVPINANMVEAHKVEGLDLFNKFNLEYKVTGRFTPYPSYSRCTGCPLFAACNDRHAFPRPVEIDIRPTE